MTKRPTTREPRARRAGRVAALTLVACLAVAGSAAAEVRWVRSPTGNLACEMADRDQRGSYVHCQSYVRPQSVTMGPRGALRICRGERCLGDPPHDATVTLRYGRSARLGRYRCTSSRDGMRCRVVASGRGFLINRDRVARIG